MRIAIIAGAILFVGLQCVEVWQILNLRSRIADAEWSLEVQSKQEEDTITPDVGVIQFLKRGYSIELQSAKYTGDGLTLNGFVGNPTNLVVSNLSVKFMVTKPLYEYRDEFRKDSFLFFIGPPAIGEAQTPPISTLPPRVREPFEVTIPNVKQTKDGIRIRVLFTGERYSY